MTVVNLAAGNGDQQYTVSDAREAATKGLKLVQSIAAACGLCNDAEFGATEHDEPSEVRKVNGDATGGYYVQLVSSGILTF